MLRRTISVAISQEENERLEKLREVNVKIVDVFRRGLTEMFKEKFATKKS